MQTLQKIYGRFQDEISREIFKNRLMYSISGDDRYAYEIVRKLHAGGGKIFDRIYASARKEGIVIFGAGMWGKELYHSAKELPWKCFIDNKPKQDMYEGLPVICCTDFLKNYQRETVCIASKIYHREMYEQLLQYGLKPENIINVGKLVDELAVRQYFDLESLKHAKGKEIFVDAGSWDGMTSVHFQNWCRSDSLVYVFEPDQTRQKICMDTLEKNNVNYRFVPKGVWSRETKLYFNSNGENSGRIEESGDETIEVISLDNALAGVNPTFIKMDIEGAEYQALLGAERIIRENRPQLAVCVYHKSEDILKIPDIILKFYPGYRLYLRHYSIKKYETVLYALP